MAGASARSGELVVRHRPDGVDRQPTDPRPIEMHVVRRQVQLLEVGADCDGGYAVVAKVGDRRMTVALRELLPVVTEEQAMVDDHGQLAAERPCDALLRLFVGAVIRAADHVGDCEVEVVGDRR